MSVPVARTENTSSRWRLWLALSRVAVACALLLFGYYGVQQVGSLGDYCLMLGLLGLWLVRFWRTEGERVAREVSVPVFSTPMTEQTVAPTVPRRWWTDTPTRNEIQQVQGRSGQK